MDFIHKYIFTIILIKIIHSQFGLAEIAKCLENGQFYRLKNQADCSKYYLCLDGDVFEFQCSRGGFFDVEHQICTNQTNCDDKCFKINQTSCENGKTCIPTKYICDGAIDCDDASDEFECNLRPDPHQATNCKSTCKLPNCFCSKDGTQIPGNLNPNRIPQIVLLTFTGPVDAEVLPLLDKLLRPHRKNPNNCPIAATFFVSHEYNDYYEIQKLAEKGHEIAVNSVSKRSPANWWTYNASIEDYFDEFVGQANILSKFSAIEPSEIRGLRVPYLALGADRQFLMMQEFGFVYDSTIVAPYSNPPLWPYSLDHKIPHSCTNKKQKCPQRSYENLWEIVINPLETGNGQICKTLQSCPFELNSTEIYGILENNFQRHYHHNRAPFGIHLDLEYYGEIEDYLDVFEKFLDKLLKFEDVWFITNWQALEWMKKPKILENFQKFSWNCHSKNHKICQKPNICHFDDIQMRTCLECPKIYPWIRNEFGHI